MFDIDIGENAFEHLELLTERSRAQVTLAILKQHIKPGMSVLDLGCGALGTFAIAAAKLGATRVVAVDQVRTDIAQAVARDNGIEFIEWVESKIEQLPDLGKFDVIVSFIWVDTPWENEQILNTYRDAIDRFSTSKSIVIPNRIELTTIALGITAETVNDRIQAAEQDTCISLTFLHDRIFSPMHRLSLQNRIEKEELSYPTVYKMPVIITKDGYLTGFKWISRLYFQDVVLRTATTISGAVHRHQVKVGDVVNTCIPDMRFNIDVTIT